MGRESIELLNELAVVPVLPLLLFMGSSSEVDALVLLLHLSVVFFGCRLISSSKKGE
jgi:hypothetical protein